MTESDVGFGTESDRELAAEAWTQEDVHVHHLQESEPQGGKDGLDRASLWLKSEWSWWCRWGDGSLTRLGLQTLSQGRSLRGKQSSLTPAVTQQL